MNEWMNEWILKWMNEWENTSIWTTLATALWNHRELPFTWLAILTSSSNLTILLTVPRGNRNIFTAFSTSSAPCNQSINHIHGSILHQSINNFCVFILNAAEFKLFGICLLIEDLTPRPRFGGLYELPLYSLNDLFVKKSYKIKVIFSTNIQASTKVGEKMAG